MGTLLEDATLSGANLAGADLTGATINGATLRGTVLPKARLVGALLLSANLQEAYLTNADFTSAGLTGARLQGACLTNTNFDNANLTWAHLTAGKTLGVLATGCLLEYRWAAFAMLNGSRRLRYGCEEHSLEDWRKKAEKVASKYVAACNVPTYTRAILSLVDFVERL
jgi:uncharacterized protein YjbI with pentapeptide repeats